MKYDSVAIHKRRVARCPRARQVLRTYGTRVRCTLFVALLAVTLPAIAEVHSGEQTVRANDCFACQAVDHVVVGTPVVRRFAHPPHAKAKLIHRVDYAHAESSGQIPVPSHPKLAPPQRDEVIFWTLSANPAALSDDPASGKTYTYTVDGKSVTLDFPVYRPGTTKVTETVFRGYELFNSYCYRCHGQDAAGVETAPDLRHSVLDGMSAAQMIQISMKGIKDKGMPAWAGFFSSADINAIYQYVAGRAYHLVGEGMPPK